MVSDVVSQDPSPSLLADQISVLAPPQLRAMLSNDVLACHRLHEGVFGPGRFARTAYRLREHHHFGLDVGLSLVAEIAVDGDATAIVGAVAQSRVLIGGAPAVWLGPIAVHQSWRRTGLGLQLLKRAVAMAEDSDAIAVALVGDPPFYEAAGFKIAAHGQLSMPGPVDPGRLLFKPLGGTSFSDVRGQVSADRSKPAA